jgi:hypothetical protein
MICCVSPSGFAWGARVYGIVMGMGRVWGCRRVVEVGEWLRGVCLPDENCAAKFGTSRVESDSLDSEGTDGGGAGGVGDVIADWSAGEEGGRRGLCASFSFTMIEPLFFSGGVSDVAGAKEAKSDCKLGSRWFSLLMSAGGDVGRLSSVGDVTIGTLACVSVTGGAIEVESLSVALEGGEEYASIVGMGELEYMIRGDEGVTGGEEIMG